MIVQTEVEPAAVESARLFGIDIDRVSLPDAVELVLDWCQLESDGCRYVVTPNVNHIVLLQRERLLQQAYRHASLVVADGWPVVAAGRLLGASLPERVAGSDLVPAVFDRCNTIGGLRVFLLGGRPGVGARAATAIQNLWSEVHVVGHLSPSFGFENDPHECKQVAEAINAQRPDFLVVGLGAPKQELWLHRFQHQISARVAVAAGATIDFLAGEQVRAPRAVQKMGLEWLFRIATDPTRLARRYLHDGVAFPCLLARELARQYLSAPPIAEHCSETSRFRGV